MKRNINLLSKKQKIQNKKQYGIEKEISFAIKR